MGAALGVAVLGAALGTSTGLSGAMNADIAAGRPGPDMENEFRLVFALAAIVSGTGIAFVAAARRMTRSA